MYWGPIETVHECSAEPRFFCGCARERERLDETCQTALLWYTNKQRCIRCCIPLDNCIEARSHGLVSAKTVSRAVSTGEDWICDVCEGFDPARSLQPSLHSEAHKLDPFNRPRTRLCTQVLTSIIKEETLSLVFVHLPRCCQRHNVSGPR